MTRVGQVWSSNDAYGVAMLIVSSKIGRYCYEHVAVRLDDGSVGTWLESGDWDLVWWFKRLF